MPFFFRAKNFHFRFLVDKVWPANCGVNNFRFEKVMKLGVCKRVILIAFSFNERHAITALEFRKFYSHINVVSEFK